MAIKPKIQVLNVIKENPGINYTRLFHKLFCKEYEGKKARQIERELERRADEDYHRNEHVRICRGVRPPHISLYNLDNMIGFCNNSGIKREIKNPKDPLNDAYFHMTGLLAILKDEGKIDTKVKRFESIEADGSPIWIATYAPRK